MDANQSNAIESLAFAIKWLSTAYWYEGRDLEQVFVNLERAEENIKNAQDAIKEYKTEILDR